MIIMIISKAQILKKPSALYNLYTKNIMGLGELVKVHVKKKKKKKNFLQYI